ncbi:MAG: GNAT family N-acetyltransferase, partial [Chloroflexi bacterium]|nr:GNAT family N-acetyltransferase [Chloroflexota bacterium]
VSPLLFANDQLDLIVLSVDEQPVAFSYVFRLSRTQLGQLLAYDPDYSAGAPARVLMELFVQEAFANSTETIDFGHYYSYKEEWADRLKSRLNIELYPRRPLPLIVYSLSNTAQSLKSRSKQIVPLRRAVQFVRKQHQNLLARRYNLQQEPD